MRHLLKSIAVIVVAGLLAASSALTKLFTGGAFGWSAGADATYTIFNAGAGRANVRLTEAQRAAALATYQKTIQTRFAKSPTRSPGAVPSTKSSARASGNRPRRPTSMC